MCALVLGPCMHLKAREYICCREKERVVELCVENLKCAVVDTWRYITPKKW